MTTKMMNASDLFIKALENEGVEYIYGIPGEENLDLLEAIRKSNIKLILTRHEQAAAFMAATYARVTGKLGVAVSTLGPGATNFTTSAAYAQLGGFPILFITGQKPIKSSKQGRFQIIDVVAMMKPLTKYAKQIVDVNMVTSVVREACRIATEERPGAVHIEFPEDVSDEPVTEHTQGLFAVSRPCLPEPNLTAVADAVNLIKSAKRPLVIIGSACTRYGIANTVAEFIDETELYFATSQMGKGVVSNKSPYYLGTCALSAHDYVHDAIDNADLIINIGYDVIEKPPYFLSADSQCKVIHINYFSANVDNVYNPSLEVIGNIKTTLNYLIQQLQGCKFDNSYFIKVKNFINTHLTKDDTNDTFPLIPQRIIHDINQVVNGNGILALDNGMYKLWFTRHYQSTETFDLLVDNALATMGAGLPAAIELARLYPEKHVIAVVGDGGFMMNSQEMETAKRLGVNLTVIILNDSAYGMIKWKQSAMGLGDYGLDFANPDFVAYAHSYGATGYRITNSEEFATILTKCITQQGVHLIDLPIDYSPNSKILTEELNNRSRIS